MFICWQRDEAQPPATFIAFDRAGYRAPIYIEQEAGEGGMRAARLLQHTLATASGWHPGTFPIQLDGKIGARARGIFLSVRPDSSTRAALSFPVSYSIAAGRLTIMSKTSETLESAVSWFLEKELGAHWFMPGPLGEHVPRRESLILGDKTESIIPSFISRDLGGFVSPVENEWSTRNRLQVLFEHRHSMSAVFQPEDLRQHPELAPVLGGRSFFPGEEKQHNWQPNFTAPFAAGHAAAVLNRWLDESPTRLSVPLAINDSYRFDQSTATRELLDPPRYFRGRPDYSDLLFGFINRVAAEVARTHPDRYLTTYAYYWTEDTPRFRVEPNVVPYLTADRSQWFDPANAAEDRQLIARWLAAGPREVGIYDYYYGAPFLVPRPTLYTVAQSIPYAHQAGVRAFFAETHPNWGLDGPKLWLAAQLLWDARQDPFRLLDTYYREFWQEAAGPMREYFETCDAQWLAQPRPAYWLKYYKDEHQYLLYPATARLALRQRLTAAAALAKSREVRERVEFVRAAFAASEAFIEFCELRDQLARDVLDPASSPRRIARDTRRHRQARTALPGIFAALQTRYPLALGGSLPEEYLRNNPLGAAVARLQTEGGELLNELTGEFPEVTALGKQSVAPAGRPLALDGELQTVRLTPGFDSRTLNWTLAGQWQGYGEPVELRKVSLVPGSAQNALRWEGCKQETLAQWHAAEPGALYAATAHVRGKVSPGNHTFLMVIFLDSAGRYLGLGRTMRLPIGDWTVGVALTVRVRAPANAHRIGFGVRVLNQVNDDFAEFSQLRLEQL